ncbi:MAG: RHS repeat-associated core domain-containing protein [Balneolaceae bacterium]|nr:RHS repeat-associated core domain-containing protein [Balneolaceae bacterium]MBO6547125.1 RHS repeat-associated core domain-containing protein [Balneolaceae bacterium]MBO6647928.1 RHS repeat-associated core domain-containing protein [Balneolaceae bacterium]
MFRLVPKVHLRNGVGKLQLLNPELLELDTEGNLGIYHMNARGMDPVTGRFLQLDPMQEFASPYVYAGNNPVSLTDPTGMSTECNEGEKEEDCRVRKAANERREQRQQEHEAELFSGLGFSVGPTGSTSGGNVIKNEGSTDKEESGGKNIEQPKKINWHSSSGTEKLRQILLYLIFLNNAGVEGGDFRDVFDFTLGGKEEGPVTGFSGAEVAGKVYINGTEIDLSFDFNWANYDAWSDDPNITKFTFNDAAFPRRSPKLVGNNIYGGHARFEYKQSLTSDRRTFSIKFHGENKILQASLFRKYYVPKPIFTIKND